MAVATAILRVIARRQTLPPQFKATNPRVSHGRPELAILWGGATQLSRLKPHRAGSSLRLRSAGFPPTRLGVLCFVSLLSASFCFRSHGGCADMSWRCDDYVNGRTACDTGSSSSSCDQTSEEQTRGWEWGWGEMQGGQSSAGIFVLPLIPLFFSIFCQELQRM